MNRKHFIVTSASIALAATVVADGCSTDSVFHPGGGGAGGSMYELNVGYATTTVGGYRVRLRNYNGTPVGPTLSATPGETLTIKVVNALPPNPPATLPQGSVRVPTASGNSLMRMMGKAPMATHLTSGPYDPMNNPHSFNTTNVHVHGIQTIPHLFAPVGTSDPAAMMIGIEPGTSFQYAFPIPADQPSGLYWYHPHHHGSTDVQVSSGMAGLIVVYGPIDQVPEIAAARDIHMAVQTIGFNQSATDPTLYEYEPLAYQTAANGGYNFGPNINLFTVDGQPVTMLNNTTGAYTPLTPYQLSMKPGEVIRLRLLNGTNCFNLPLVLPGCEMFIIGYDGINTLAPIPVAHNTVTPIGTADRIANTVAFTAPGNRIELLIRAPQTPGTFTLSCVGTTDINFQAFPQVDLATVTVSGTPVTMNIPTTLPTEGNAPTLLTGFGFFVDNRLYDEMSVNYTVRNGTAEEWIISNSSGDPHPFHLHENSYEVLEINGVPGDYGLFDTFLVPKANGANGSIKIRVRFKGDPGKTVFHCHILPHEDTGMMQNLMMV